MTKPGDRLLVGTSDLRKTPYSEAFIYYFFPELRPGTYYIEMDPGVANREGSRLADDVASSDVLVLDLIWDVWDEPNDSRKVGSDRPNQVLRRAVQALWRVRRPVRALGAQVSSAAPTLAVDQQGGRGRTTRGVGDMSSGDMTSDHTHRRRAGTQRPDVHRAGDRSRDRRHARAPALAEIAERAGSAPHPHAGVARSLRPRGGGVGGARVDRRPALGRGGHRGHHAVVVRAGPSSGRQA